MKGLVLEGGGTKGAYQIGAYKALRDLGIEFQGVAGTSIGALNGAYIIQNDIEIMEDIWLTYDYTHFMNIDEETYEKYKNVDFTAKNINSVIELINKARKNEGIDISPLRELLEKTLNEDIIRKSNKDFGLVTVWWDKKINPHPLYIEDIPNKRLIDYLIASSSLPIFQLNRIDDKLFLDGMFFDNMPISLLKQKGYEDIVVIRLLDDFLGKINLNKYQNINIKKIYQRKRKVYQEGRRRMEKQIAAIFSLLSFNYLMFKYWGTWKITLLALIGNYFFICILIKSYIGLPKFIEDFNVIFIFGICVLGAYNLWRKNKAGTLNEYEKRGWFLMRIFSLLFILALLLLVLIFIFMEYIYGIYI